jgi:Long-chain fatty acid transport protein
MTTTKTLASALFASIACNACANGTLISGMPENRENIMRHSVGATWHVDGKLNLRGGIAYEYAPMPDTFRTPRIPDGNRTWLAFGGQYRLSRQGSADVGYAHLFFSDPKLDMTGGGTTLGGRYSSAADILGAQYTHTFWAAFTGMIEAVI